MTKYIVRYIVRIVLFFVFGFLGLAASSTYQNYVDAEFAKSEREEIAREEAKRISRIQWEWSNVRPTESEYKACDTVILTGYRTSTVNAQLDIIDELVLVEPGLEIELYKYPLKPASVGIQEGNLTVPTSLPCEKIDINPGTYVLQGTVVVNYQNDTNTFTWRSAEFEVVE